MPSMNKGEANPILEFFAENPTTKAPVTTLTAADLTIQHSRTLDGSGAQNAMTTAATINDLTALTDAWSGGATGVDTWAVLHKSGGVYRLDCPVDLAATGAKFADVIISDASGTDFYVQPILIELFDTMVVDVNGRGDISKIEGTDATDMIDARIDARLAAINLDDQSVPSRSIITGVVAAAGSTTSVPTSSISPSFACLTNQWGGSTPKGIYFAADTTTVGLRGVYRPISSHTSGTTPTFTVAALPATPVAGDVFSIL